MKNEASNPQPGTAATGHEAGAESGLESEKERLSYQGIRVPWFLVLIWVAFLIWGTIYLLRYVPPSVREWFLQK